MASGSQSTGQPPTLFARFGEIMPIRAMFVLATLGLAACSGDDEVPLSKPTDPSVVFEIPPPAVNDEWPCPPFGSPTTEEDLQDTDGDLLANCQELTIGTDPTSTDTDEDGFSDYEELGQGGLLEPEDTDRDDVIDAADDDDDDDGVLTADEGALADFDGDGVPNHLDEDDDNDDIVAILEDADGDGDVTNDDADEDGVPNWLDRDDDNDGVNSEFEHSGDDPADTDIDGDYLPDYIDTDDDGDGIVSRDEDTDGDGDPTNDDLDGDGDADFQDIDQDGDGIDFEDLDADGTALDHDTDGDGLADFTDADDDGDGVLTSLEVDPAEMDPLPPEAYDLDGDGRPNYRDANDDGDGCDTLLEDADGDGDPSNDNTVVNAGDDPPDYLDPTTETCASPEPEAAATYSLTLVLENLPSGAEAGDLLVAVDDGANVVRGSAPVGPTSVTLVLPAAFGGATAPVVNLTFDLDANGTCDNGPERITSSFLVEGLTVDNYDVDLLIDVVGRVVDRAGVTISADPAACDAQ